MDPVLSTAYPVHKIGSDGLSWWVGQVESFAEGDPNGNNDLKDPKKSGRYRVRIVGRHLKDCNSTPSSDLPWAHVMMPATSPWSDGGKTGGTIGYTVGSWVIGIYLDNDQQKPLIIGSIGHTAGATLLENVENDPNPTGTCKSFTTFISPGTNPFVHAPISQEDLREDARPAAQETEGSTTLPAAGLPAIAARPGYQPSAFYALFADASETNPTGKKVCVEIANPKCGSEKNFESNLKNIIADMLKANQQSNGNIGTYYVSKANGELNNYISTGRTYINKAIRLVTSLIARLKGEIVKLIRDGIDKLVEVILYEDVDTKDVLGNVNTGPVAPDLGVEPFKPITKKQSRLKEVIDAINDVLEEVGCSMEDLTERISDYVTDLLWGFLKDAYEGAACLVDTLVSGIINQIIEFIETTLASILGPLNDLLGVLVEPVNLIGNIVSEAFDLLGISCDGPKATCEKIEKVCVDCNNGDTDDNWLDDLLDLISDGPLDNNQYICDEALVAADTPATVISFVGGIPGAVGRGDTPGEGDPVPTTKLIQYTCEDITVIEGEPAVFTIRRFGDISKSSSIKLKVVPKTATLNEDFAEDFEGSSIGFGPYQTEKNIAFRTFKDKDQKEGDEYFFIRLESRVLPADYAVNFPNGRDFRCTIEDAFTSLPFVPNPNDPDPYIPPSIVLPPDYVTPNPIPTITPSITRFNVKAERSFYLEGQSPRFIITGRNAVVGQTYNYSLNVDPEDIVDGETTGTFVVNEDQQGFVIFTLATDNDNFRVDPPGTIPVLDAEGNVQLDEEGNVIYNEEEIVTEFDDLNETLTLTVTETGDSGFTTILGEDNGEPSYFVRADANSYSEGDTITYTITTNNVDTGTLLFYTLSGDGTTVVDGDLSGSFEIVDGVAQVFVTLLTNDTIDPSRLLNFDLDVDAGVTVIISPDTTGLIPDDEEDTTPLYQVVSDKLEYKEGETIVYTISTDNVPDGTVLQWALSGAGITPEDIVGGNLYGNSVIIDNSAKVYVTIEEDVEIEGSENMTFLLVGTGAFASVIIIGEILDEGDSDTDPIVELKPCLDKPIAGQPITDDTGSIISIPVINQGCPYLEPPRVIIGGAGSGATAIALLDNANKVSEIRVTRVGNGYKPNTSTEQDLTCVIDSFTILNAGSGYKTAPQVLINGQAGYAEAEINERGLVISVRILDRSLEVIGLPRVTFQGGGGFGARALPSIVCLDTIDELAASGYAKIGTGKYIDCP